MSETLLRLAEVMKRVGLRKTAIYAAIDRGEFPKPCKIGLSSRWPESEIEAYIEALKAARNGDENGDQREAA